MKIDLKNLLTIDIKTIAVVVLVGVIVFQRCGGNNITPSKNPIVKIDGKKYEEIKHTIDTQYIPQPYTVIKKGKDIYHDTTIYVKIPTDKPIDTALILKNFYAKNVYKDTLFMKDSNLGYVSVVDTISENRILNRKWDSQIKKLMVKDVQIVKELPTNQIYVGVNGSMNKVDIVSSIGAGVILKTKTDKIYQLGVGIDNRINGTLTPFIGGGIYWKLKLKK